MAFIVTFLIAGIVAWLWANEVNNKLKYREKNSDYNQCEGWLDWDNAHTEGEI
ncbi:hypothetical protein UFOVP449_212 [uncultured Caudovirales phage]|uniref:Uncharacterized protein n=1 Tax=uncultured Caudovirales phage TaxID=2100421 RepID=A0A6J5MB75_9CAUD|nr:hypothetical protein UFOVP449_212 [uncultured Caudovirales phage]